MSHELMNQIWKLPKIEFAMDAASFLAATVDKVDGPGPSISSLLRNTRSFSISRIIEFLNFQTNVDLIQISRQVVWRQSLVRTSYSE